MNNLRPEILALNPELFRTGLAKLTYERLIEYIRKFEEDLDESQEIGARLVSFGGNCVFHITSLDFRGQEMIIFNGIDDKGQKVQLFQHVTQLNVLLVAVKKIGDNPARRIGFHKEEQI
ncbi:MAG TPA: DUF6173 family protein [Aquella sp.]|nr:DUF6173 family protein [Aquella sp.]